MLFKISYNIFSYPKVILVLLFKFVYFLLVQIFVGYIIFIFQLALRHLKVYTVYLLTPYRIFELRVLLSRISQINCNTVPKGSILTRKRPGYSMLPSLFAYFLFMCA